LQTKPVKSEFLAGRALLNLYGEAPGLVNLNKCVVATIACDNIDVQEIIQLFLCNVVKFPRNFRLLQFEGGN
jgi:hypothetical protein